MVPRWPREAGTALLLTAGFAVLLFGLPLAVALLLPSEVVTARCPGPICTTVLVATTLLAFAICFRCASWLADRGYLGLPDAR